jgi:hypothetical protein
MTVSTPETIESVLAPMTPRRRRGRPGWTREVFDAHVAEAEERAGHPATDKRVAEHFRPLDGLPGLGIEPNHLARLRRRRALPHGAPGAMPE